MLPMLDAGLVPPVALLVYNPEDSREAVFYPFAEFSPEWNALRYALARDIPTRFIDLPPSHQFALARPAEEGGREEAPEDLPEREAHAEPSGAPRLAGACRNIMTEIGTTWWRSAATAWSCSRRFARRW
jgi:hypothetical protein